MNPFYNREERRLRAPFRLIINLVVNMIGVGVTRILPLFLIAFIMIVAGQIPFAVLNDGPALSQALEETMTSFPALSWFLWFGAILFTFCLYLLFARFLDRRPWQDYGLRFNRIWWRDFGFGSFLGAALMALIFGVQYVLGWITITGTQSNQGSSPFWIALVTGLIYYLLVSVSEELMARGYLLRNLAEGLNLSKLGPRRALLLAYLGSSIVFGLLHAANPNATLFSTANLVLAGLFIGLPFILTGSLAIPIGLHLTWNFFQGNVFGFPVSGGASQLTVIAIQQGGADLWTGGAFGPEGGILGILAMLLGMALIYAWVRLTQGQVSLDTSLSHFTPLYRKQKPAAEEAFSPSSQTN